MMKRSNESWSLGHCLNVCKRALGTCPPIKKRSLRANNSPFINKVISNAIMDHVRFRKKNPLKQTNC